METPDEIKRGLDKCTRLGGCVSCPYYANHIMAQCTPKLAADALAYIRELEAELEAAKERENGLSILLTSAQSAAETYKRERDAAVADINMCCPCEVCTRSCTYDKVNPYDECADFEWRGVRNDA